MPSRWRTLRDPLDAPMVPGCYVGIGRNGEVLYGGSAENLRTRLIDHRRAANSSAPMEVLFREMKPRWMNEPRVRIKVRPSSKYGDWLMIELRLIRRLRPKFNVRGVKRDKRTPLQIVRERMAANG